MHIDAPPAPNPQHRLSRLHRWAMLWLKWFVAFLDGAAAFAPLSAQARAIAHNWLDRVEHLIVSVAMFRAAQRVRPVRPSRHFAQHELKIAGLRRAIIGSRLRRVLRHDDLRRRIDALGQDIDALALLVARRAPRGLTRRRAIAPSAFLLAPLALAGEIPAAHGRAAPVVALRADTS